MRRFSILIIMALTLTPSLIAQTDAPVKATESMFRKGYDIPVGIPHGTWDFDEWPGVDHPVVYKQDYMYNSTPNEKIKIDYFLSVFDKDDYQGYLKEPKDLLDHGFVDMRTVLLSRQARNRTMLGIFCHPDDEVLLAGGLLADAAKNGWTVKVILISNGADGSKGVTDTPSEALGGFNSFGILHNGKTVVQNDVMGGEKLGIVANYAKELGVPIEVLPVSLTVLGRKVVQIGEAPNIDFAKTFGPGSEYREAVRAGIAAVLQREKPGIVLTHGKDGEYGNYMHEMVHDIVLQEAGNVADVEPIDVYTCFPEFNFHDHITHFLDLNADGMTAWNAKYAALKKISFLYVPGADFDKPWDPSDTLMDGVFVKDYGYTPETGEPPRYEFFQKVQRTQE